MNELYKYPFERITSAVDFSRATRRIKRPISVYITPSVPSMGAVDLSADHIIILGSQVHFCLSGGIINESPYTVQVSATTGNNRTISGVIIVTIKDKQDVKLEIVENRREVVRLIRFKRK
jgi:hypothetical protein